MSLGCFSWVPKEDASSNENTWLSSPENSYYGLSKYHSEMEVWRGIEEGLNAVIVCPAIILGPGKWENGSSMIFKHVWKGLSFILLGQMDLLMLEMLLM